MKKLRKIFWVMLVICIVTVFTAGATVAEASEEPFELTDLWRESSSMLVLNGFIESDDGNYYNDEETVMITLTNITDQADQFLLMGDDQYSILGLTTGMFSDEVEDLMAEETLYADVLCQGLRVQMYYVEYKSFDYEVLVYYLGDMASMIGFYNLNEDDVLTLNSCEKYNESAWYAKKYSLTIQYANGEEETDECYVAYSNDGYFGIFCQELLIKIYLNDCIEEYVNGLLAIYYSEDIYALVDEENYTIDFYDEDGNYYRLEGVNEEEEDTEDEEIVVVIGEEDENSSLSSLDGESDEYWFNKYSYFFDSDADQYFQVVCEEKDGVEKVFVLNYGDDWEYLYLSTTPDAYVETDDGGYKYYDTGYEHSVMTYYPDTNTLILMESESTTYNCAAVDTVSGIDSYGFSTGYTWWDTNSYRCNMKIENILDTASGDEYYHITINWAGSASESNTWEIEHGTYDESLNAIVFSDCRYYTDIFYADGTEMVNDVYVDGTGSIVMDDNNRLYWHDDVLDSGADCVFENEYYYYGND